MRGGKLDAEKKKKKKKASAIANARAGGRDMLWRAFQLWSHFSSVGQHQLKKKKDGLYTHTHTPLLLWYEILSDTVRDANIRSGVHLELIVLLLEGGGIWSPPHQLPFVGILHKAVVS